MLKLGFGFLIFLNLYYFLGINIFEDFIKNAYIYC